MNCEVCFKEIESGRRCAKHPEVFDIIYQEIRENASIGIECRMQEVEAQQEPCHCQIPNDEGWEQSMPEKPVKGWTPLQWDTVQQVKGELNYLVNRLNEHIDLSKKARSRKEESSY